MCDGRENYDMRIGNGNSTAAQMGQGLYSRKNVVNSSTGTTFEKEILKLDRQQSSAQNCPQNNTAEVSPALSGEDYLALYRCSAASQNQSAMEHAALIRTKEDTVSTTTNAVSENKNQSTIDQLSQTGYTKVLSKMKNGGWVSHGEWQGLLSALRDAGAISSDEYLVASSYGTVVPIGYDDENGVFHPYANTVNVFVDVKGNVTHYPFDENAPRIDDLASWLDGYNDPLKYLDDWIENYREWHDYMADQTNDDGTPKYGRLDLIQNDINSASNVARVIRELMEEI